MPFSNLELTWQVSKRERQTYDLNFTIEHEILYLATTSMTLEFYLFKIRLNLNVNSRGPILTARLVSTRESI